MFYKLRRSGSVAGNTRTLNWYLWWFCLRFYFATQIVYFAHVSGSIFLASTLLALIQVAQAVFEVPTGILSDRLGRVWCVRLQVVASVLSLFFYIVGGSYFWLFIGAIFDGLWRALMNGSNEALVYDSLRQEKKLSSFAKYLAGMNVAMELGGFVSMALGGFLAAIGFGWALWLTVLMQLPALVTSLFLKEPKQHRAPQSMRPWEHFREAFGYMRRNPVVRRLSLAQILQEGCSTFALWPAYYNTFLPLGLVGVLYSANYLQSAIGFRMSGWLMRRTMPMNIVISGDVFARLLLWPALLAPTPATPYLMALAGAPYGPVTVALGKVLHDEYTDHQRATMASITSFLSSCLYGLFTIVIGVLADRIGLGKAILLGQVCTLPMTLLYIRTARQLKSGQPTVMVARDAQAS